MKRPTHVAVVWWGDAVEVSGDSTSPHMKPYPRVTTGFLLSESERGVTLSGTWDQPDQSCDGKTFIPRGMIARMLRYKVRWN